MGSTKSVLMLPLRGTRGPRVLSGYLTCYGAATSQILAIYENFKDFAVSVLLLSNCLFLRCITHQKKGSIDAWERSF